MIASSGVSDVREVLDHYNKEIDPLDTFKLNQVKLKVILIGNKSSLCYVKLLHSFLLLNFKGSRIATTARNGRNEKIQ